MSHQEDFAAAFPTLLDVMGETVTIGGVSVDAIVDRRDTMEVIDEEGLEGTKSAELSFLSSAAVPVIGDAVVFDSLNWVIVSIPRSGDGIYTARVETTQTMTRGRESYYKG